MDHHEHDPDCGCRIHTKELLYWVHKRFVENICTVDLMNMAEDDQEREVISVVALMDVDDATVQHMIAQAKDPNENILACRREIRDMLPPKE